MLTWLFLFWRLNRENIIFTIVLACCFMWAPLLLISFKLVVIPFLILSFIGITNKKYKAPEKGDLPVLGIIVLFLIWSFLSILWSIDKKFALFEFLKVLPIILGSVSIYCYFKTFDSLKAKYVIKSFLMGVIVMTYFLVLDHFLGFELQQWKHPHRAKTYSYAVLILILSLGLGLSQLQKRRWLMVPLFVMVTAFSTHYDYDAGPIALYVGAITFFMALILPATFPKYIRYGLISALLLSPVIIKLTLTPTIWPQLVENKMSHTHRQRLELLEWGNKYVLEKPLIGHGLGQTRLLQHDTKPRDYGGELQSQNLPEPLVPGPSGVCEGYWTMCVWHMHNGFMQVWVELGLVGILFIAAFMWLTLKEMESLLVTRYHRACFYAFLGSFLLIFCVSFGIWQTWWLSTISLLFILYHLNFSLLSSLHHEVANKKPTNREVNNRQARRKRAKGHA